jgi:hypothetical protein
MITTSPKRRQKRVKLDLTIVAIPLIIAFSLLTPAGAVGMGDGGHGSGPGSGPGNFEGYNGHELEHNMVLPQIAVGKDISTTLVISSHGSSEMMSWLEDGDLKVSGMVHFFNQDGSPLEVRINSDLQLSSEYSFHLEPTTTSFLKITSEGPNTPGWALITVDDSETDWGTRDGHWASRGERLMATAFYTVFGQGKVLSEVGVVPSMYEKEHFFNSALIARFGDAINTGVAVVNTNSDKAALTAYLRDSDGEVVAKNATLSLEPGNQMALFINQLFSQPIPDGFQGTLEVVSEGEGVVVMGLLMVEDILTSVPTHHFGQWRESDSMMP